MTEDQFLQEVTKLGIALTTEQQNKLNKFYQLLIEWNEKINLTTIIKKEEVYLKHFYDSLTLVKAINFNQVNSLIDIGSGAGFPGIVLKIVFPHLDIVLLDALQKRVNYLNTIIKELELKNIIAIHSRAEEYAVSHREEFDLVTARAVAALPILTEICAPFVKVGGFFLPMKGNMDIELKNSFHAFQELSLKVKRTVTFSLPVEESSRTILMLEKIAPTPLKYPRATDKIKKRPL